LHKVNIQIETETVVSQLNFHDNPAEQASAIISLKQKNNLIFQYHLHERPQQTVSKILTR